MLKEIKPTEYPLGSQRIHEENEIYYKYQLNHFVVEEGSRCFVTEEKMTLTRLKFYTKEMKDVVIMAMPVSFEPNFEEVEVKKAIQEVAEAVKKVSNTSNKRRPTPKKSAILKKETEEAKETEETKETEE